MKIIKLILIIILLTTISFVNEIGAQPYAYNTPLDKEIYSESASGKSSFIIRPTDWIAPTADRDGITITTVIQMDPATKENVDICTFYDNRSGKLEPIVKIFFDNYTFCFRRYLSETVYYDYILYDRLFTDDSWKVNKWNVRIYFTAVSFWIQTYLKDTVGQNYLSPTFFGLNILNNDFMKRILQRDQAMWILLGTENPAHIPIFQIEDGYSVYAYNYNELRLDIHNKFSWPD